VKHPKIVTAILTTVILLVLVIVIGLVVVYSGLPNVAASKPDGAVTSWVLGTTMEHSVRRQAAGISPDLSRGDGGRNVPPIGQFDVDHRPQAWIGERNGWIVDQ
jgi:hypothetical protein